MGRPKAEPRKKKEKDPNKPKRSTSAYFYFLAAKRVEFKRVGKNTSKIAEFTKECSEIWRNMDGTDKKPFDKKAAEDKARYDKEMAAYKGKSPKDDGKPKRPQTAYFLFLADFRVRMKNSNIDHRDIIKKAGEEWRKLADPKKKEYEGKAQLEVKKYECALKEWQQQGGGAAKSEPPADNCMDDDEEDEDDEDEEDDDEDDDE